jgi:uncharacterized protein (DUF58 family)
VKRRRRALGPLASRRGLLRLNHVFIPEKKPDRDRARRSLPGRVLSPLWGAYMSLSREGRGLLLLSLFVGIAGLDVRTSEVHLFFAMLVGVLFTSVVARFFFGAPGLRVSVEAPPRVSVGDALRFLVHLDNRGGRRLLALRVGGPFLPWDGAWTSAPPGVAALEPGARATLSAEARFVARGEHHLDAFNAALLVPLGLALGPARESEGVRFLVVPRIAAVAALDLSQRAPGNPPGRIVAQAKGESDIAGVRPYRAGDPLRHLHVRTWARTGTPHVRQYVDEQRDRVALLVWVDGAEASERAREAALSVAAGAAASLTLHGAGLDLLVVDDRPLRVEPRTGASALDQVVDRLAVHRLTEEEAVPEAVIDAHRGGLSTVVLVTADEDPRRRALIGALARRGLPVRWLSVVEDDRRGAPPPPLASQVEVAGAPVTRISVARVEASGAPA